MKQCGQCTAQLKDADRVCPSCGAKQPRQKGISIWLVLALGGLAVVACLVSAVMYIAPIIGQNIQDLLSSW